MGNIEVPKEAFSERQKHFHDATNSDITVFYGADHNHLFKTFAHKQILGHYSGYFKRVFAKTPSMKQIYLPDDPAAVEDMLRHIYDLEPAENPMRTALHDLTLWDLAYDYEVPTLIKTSESSVTAQLRATVGGVKLFTEVVRAIYRLAISRSSALRGMALQVCHENFEDLRQHIRFHNLLHDESGLALELLVYTEEQVQTAMRRGL